MYRTEGEPRIRFTGWIKPDGTLLHCEAYDHLWIAHEAGVRDPDAAGWTHCAGSEFDPMEVEPTTRQINTITDICTADGIPLPEWVLGWLDR